MESLHMLARHPVFLALEHALLGFLWQGAAVALVVAGLLALMPERAARARYAISCLGLLAMAVLPAVSFFSALADAARFVFSEGLSAPVDPSVPADVSITVLTASEPLGDSPWLESLRPWLLPAWCCGVLVLSCRTLLAWSMTQRMSRRDTFEPALAWKDALVKALVRMRMTGPVRLRACASIDVPMVIGLWRPLILVPAGALTGLNPAQLEAILAHELAHIRRHDYLVNLLQSLVETFLFYHPAVWWLSHRIREEREHCADDLAVQCCGDAYLYARALAHIEQLRVSPSPHPALGASGGSLLTRVRRLLVAPEAGIPRRPWRMASGISGVLLAAVLGSSQLPETARAEEPAPSPEPELEAPAAPDTRAPRHTAQLPRPFVAPAPLPAALSQAPGRAARPAVRTAPKEARAPAVKARAPGPMPLLIPDTQAIARTELPRVPYSLDAEPAESAVASAEPMMEEEAPTIAVAAPVLISAAQRTRVMELGPDVTPPRFISGERFHYPNLTYGLRAQIASFPRGAVVTRCTITTEGTVTDCKPLQGLSGLEDAVIRTLSTWRYEPAMLDGKPVAVHYVFDILFTNTPGGGRAEPPERKLAALDVNQYRGAAGNHSCMICTSYKPFGPVRFRSGGNF
ncbi:M56 family metallopeptidase [Pyxidicoccus xibeiensis]|uniref:M56 family metallopeptidase n=1 Tax=Pyxidicoccus xibeiensis TaxID=2906759 RepID=UPI0020A7DCD7|nr:M56 family metallopeptidase [Pyxidicoccus xibeiensis]MCP3137706.1 energy transducer TonB [Pyxidicoccus xibeiensis]